MSSISITKHRKKTNSYELVFFQLNPPLAEEIHLRWMKSLRDEIRLRRDKRTDLISSEAALSIAIMSPLLRVEGFSIKESFVAADVNFMSEGSPSLA